MASLIDERIKYYSRNDIMYPIMCNKATKYYLNNYSTKSSYRFENINDLLEFYNILKYFNDFDSKTLANANINTDIGVLEKNFSSAAGRYFVSINNKTELEEIIKSIENQYRDDLILIFSQFSNVTKKFLTDDVIIFLCENSYLKFILDNKNFLNQYSSLLKSFLFSHIESFPFYLSKDLVNSNAPFKFSSQDFNFLVDKYRFLPKEKINYGALVQILKNRLLSKKGRYHVSDLKDELANDFHNYVNFHCEVKFIPQEELSNFEMYKGKLSYCCSYDVKWISKYLDYSTILNNFIHIFSFIDLNHRISFVNLPLYSKNSNLVKLGFIKQRVSEFGSYPTWKSLFNLAVIKTCAYSKFLKDNNVYIEDVIDWFFGDYIETEFSIDNFNIKINDAKKVESYSNKLKIVLTEFESIFKQFEAYSEFGYVNHGYISNVLNDGENAYPESLKTSKVTYVEKSNSDDAKIIFNDLFSDDYRLKEHKNLFDFLIKNKKGIEPQLLSELNPSFNLLIKNKILFQNSSGKLYPDTFKLLILEQAEDYGYLCFNFLNDVDQKDINELINSKLLTSYNSFMSKQENDLFNFVFNNKFTNTSLGIRNLYMHGNPSLDMAEHEFNYFISLTMMIVLVLKLNDAFTIMTSKDQGKGRFNNVLEDENSIILT